MILALRDAAEVPRAGNKAQTLARLMQAELPVLDGIVVLPDAPLADIEAALAPLGPGPFVVRSSSPREDDTAGSAAGLYSSFVDVPASRIAAAIERVRASAHAEAVRLYLEARGHEPEPIAALVQPYLRAATLGVARSIEGGFLVEERPAGTPEWSDATAARLDRALADPLVPILVRVEQIVGRAVDVEYARVDGRLVLLQARPGPPAVAPGAIAFPPGRWRLDAEHNPDPVSLAQAGLVALVDGPRFGPRARVIGGYLYVREQPRRDGGIVLEWPLETIDDLRAELAAADGASLPAALAVYVRVIRRYAWGLRAAVAAARERLDGLLQRELGESLWDHPQLFGGTGGATTERDAALYALGRDPSDARVEAYLLRYGAYAPAWDVAVPCDDEDRARLLSAAAQRALGPAPEIQARTAAVAAAESARALRERMSPAARGELDRSVAHLRELLTLAESDDLVFFEGQRLVRRALLRRGEALVTAGRLRAVEDIFDIPLTAALTARPLDRLAEQGRRARAAAARFVPPARIVDRVPQVRLPASSEVLHGHGIGGTGRGPAFVIASLVAPLPEVPEGAVLIVSAALPSLAPLLPRLAALVTEHGGALSHGATLAREIGLPAVVGVAGAASIPPGTMVYVDGERGRVLLLRPST